MSSRLYFLEQLQILIIIRWRSQRYSYNICPYIHTTSSTIKIPYHSGTFVIINERALIYLYYAKLIVYIRVYSWLYIVHEFEQMYTVDMNFWKFTWRVKRPKIANAKNRVGGWTLFNSKTCYTEEHSQMTDDTQHNITMKLK